VGFDTVSSNRSRLYAVTGSAAVLAAALAYTGLVDPHKPGSPFPSCPFRLLTGWYCPACGGLRMIHDLLHGDLAAAVADNVLLLVGLPVLTVWMLMRLRRGEPVLPTPAVVSLAVAATTWLVLRNLPGFPLTP
jgi:hypothetical protein